MVNVYIRRKKKIMLFYSRRRRGYREQEPSPPLTIELIDSLKEKDQNNGFFPSDKVLVDTLSDGLPEACIFQTNQENSDINFGSEAIVTSIQMEENIVSITGGRSSEDAKKRVHIGIKMLDNEPLLSVMDELSSKICLQRRPRSARKSASLSQRRWSLNEYRASDHSKQLSSHLGESTSVCYEIMPKTPIKEDKIYKPTPQSLVHNVHKLPFLEINAVCRGWKGSPAFYCKRGRRKYQKPFLNLLHVLQAGLKLPKGPRSTRVKSKVNQASRNLIFCDVDPLHRPACKKRGVDIQFAKEFSFKESREINSTNPCQSKTGYVLLKPKISNIRICLKNAKFSSRCIPDISLSNASFLLAVGVLEKLFVNYMKVKLLGCINDLGTTCGCSLCHFMKVLSLNFEKHSGTSCVNPNNCINANNKIAFCALVKEMGKVPFGLFTRELIQKMICCRMNNISFFPQKEFYIANEINPNIASCGNGKNQLSHILRHRRILSERLMLSGLEENLPFPSKSDVKVKFRGEAEKTMKHREQEFHQQIFELLNDGSKLLYYSHGKVVLEGYKFGKNILCSCCNVMLSASKFEAHAGHVKRRKPYHSIYTSYGKSLHQITVFLLRDKNSFDFSNKDPFLTHKTEGEPSFALRYQNACNAGEQSSTTALSPSGFQLVKRVLVPSCILSSCMLCGNGDATLNFGNICDSTMLLCGQCCRMFHVGCLRHQGICCIKARPKLPDIWLCGDNCRKVYSDLLNFVKEGPTAISESMLNSLHNSVKSTLLEETKVDVHWQVLSGRIHGEKSKLFLQQATAIFQEAFGVVYKGHRDVLSTMVHGERGVSEFFGGMFCAALTVKSVIISVALLRVFGNYVAELPLVATCMERRREGFFRILFLKIEEMLSFMKVKNLILPADAHSHSMWVEKFGFINLSAEEIREYQMKHRILMFENATVLQKTLPSKRRMSRCLKVSLQKPVFARLTLLRLACALPSASAMTAVPSADRSAAAEFHLSHISNHLRFGWTEAAVTLAKTLISSHRDIFPSPIHLYQSLSAHSPAFSSQAASLVVSACAQLRLGDEALRLVSFLPSDHFPYLPSCKHLLELLVSCRRYSDVLLFFSQIKGSCVRIDIFVYNKAIEATVKLGDVDAALQLMNLMERNDLIQPNAFTFNVLISGKWKERKAADAQKLFDDMLERKLSPNLVTYNAMIDGYCKVGNLDAVSGVLERMVAGRVEPNLTTFNCLLWGFCQAGRLEEAEDLLKEMKGKGLAPDGFTYSTLFTGYMNSGNKRASVDLFEECVRKGIRLEAYPCSVLLSGLCKDGDVFEAEEILTKTVNMGLVPTIVMYNCIVDGYCRIGDIEGAFTAVRRMESLGLKSNHITYNSLIKGMCKLKKMEDAEKLLKEMREKGEAPTVETMNTLIDAYSRDGKFTRCFEILEEMEEKMLLKPNVVSYGALINGFCKIGKLHEAHALFADTLIRGIKVNEMIYNMLIDAYSVNGNFEMVNKLMLEMKEAGFCPNIVTYNSLIKGLCRKGCLSDAEEIISKLQNEGMHLDVVTYNTLMAAYCNYNDFQKAIEFFNEMEKLGIKPNLASYYILISKLCVDGKMQDVDNLYQHLLQKKMNPDKGLYGAMISGYVRIGNHSKVLALQEDMKKCGIALGELISVSNEGAAEFQI